jgi:hypothetical protein
LPEPVTAPFGSHATADDILECARKDGLREPVLELPSPIITNAPCRLCGAPIAIGRPDWMLQAAPQCSGACVKSKQSQGMQMVQRIGLGHQLGTWTLASLGLVPLGWCIVEDDQSDEVRVYELPGSLDDVFVKVTRAAR